MKLYDFKRSGNGYKLRLCAHQLSLPLELVDVDITSAENRRAEFLAKNPHGRVPLLETDDGRFLPESNAILCYLAEGSPLLPSDRYLRGVVLGWLFFEQNNLEPNVANNRYWISVVKTADEYADEIRIRHKHGMDALRRMDEHLATHRFFAGDLYTVADIGLYAYSHVAREGDFDLDAFPNVLAWQARVREQPRHITMEERP